MCKYCRKTEQGKKLWIAYLEAKKAVENANLSPSIAGFMQKYGAKKVVDEQPINDDFFEQNEDSLLAQYNATDKAVKEYHHQFVTMGLRGEL